MKLEIPITFDEEWMKKIAEDVLARLCAECPYRKNGEDYLLTIEGKDLFANRNQRWTHEDR